MLNKRTKVCQNCGETYVLTGGYVSMFICANCKNKLREEAMARTAAEKKIKGADDAAKD